MIKLLIPLTLSTSLLGFAGCSIHTVDIQQGNVITPQLQRAIAVGQTKKQVIFLLGTPLLIDPFHKDRWDYVYLHEKAEKPDLTPRLSLFFDDDKLVRIETPPLPESKIQD